MEKKVIHRVAGTTFIVTMAGIMLVQSSPLAHHKHQPHAAATAHISVGTLVSSGSTGEAFRAQYAATLDALTDDVRPMIYLDGSRPAIIRA